MVEQSVSHCCLVYVAGLGVGDFEVFVGTVAVGLVAEVGMER